MEKDEATTQRNVEEYMVFICLELSENPQRGSNSYERIFQEVK